MKCAACPREALGFGWMNLVQGAPKNAPQFNACSLECARTIGKHKGKMQHMTEFELDAMEHAGLAAKKYLAAHGDELANWEEVQFMELIELIVSANAEYIQGKGRE